jgi:hypothetical protein
LEAANERKMSAKEAVPNQQAPPPVDALGACMAEMTKRGAEWAAKKAASKTPKIPRCALPSCKKTAAETDEKVLYKDKAHRGSIRYCLTHSKEFIMSQFDPCPDPV